MVGYKLSKNDWVTPFFVIFRSVREKLLVTVFPEHPVYQVNRAHVDQLLVDHRNVSAQTTGVWCD